MSGRPGHCWNQRRRRKSKSIRRAFVSLSWNRVANARHIKWLQKMVTFSKCSELELPKLFRNQREPSLPFFCNMDLPLPLIYLSWTTPSSPLHTDSPPLVTTSGSAIIEATSTQESMCRLTQTLTTLSSSILASKTSENTTCLHRSIMSYRQLAAQRFHSLDIPRALLRCLSHLPKTRNTTRIASISLELLHQFLDSKMYRRKLWNLRRESKVVLQASSKRSWALMK